MASVIVGETSQGCSLSFGISHSHLHMHECWNHSRGRNQLRFLSYLNSQSFALKFQPQQQQQLELARCCSKLAPENFKSQLSTLVSSTILSLQNQFNRPSVSIPFLEEPTSHAIASVSNFQQKGFSQIGGKTSGRALHALCVKGSICLSIFHSNTLVSMYAKFGDIETARQVFDRMPQRNEASWNQMVSCCVRVGLYSEATGLFGKMRIEGFEPNGFVISSLITACTRSESMVNEGLQLHNFVFKCGLLYDIFVATALLYFYGTYGFIVSAKDLFEEMTDRNVVTWTSLMVAFSDNGDSEEVINLYKRMKYEGVNCNENTLATVITSCGLLEDELLSHQILSHVSKLGFLSNVSVANSLISMFGSRGNVENAVDVFERINERDTISWNAIISAYAHNELHEQCLRHFSRMRICHNEINSTTLSSLLSVCSSPDHLKLGEGLHALVFKLGVDLNICVCNTLLNMYFETGRVKDADFLFREMPAKDLISWNLIISFYVQDGDCLDALNAFSKLLGMKKSFNYVTFASALAACSYPEFLKEGKIVHALVILFGLHENSVIGNSLITMYGKYGMMTEAKRVVEAMPKRDVVTWNSLIGGHAENEEPEEAIKAFRLMREQGTPENYITMVNILGAFWTGNQLVRQGMPIHARITLTGFESDDYVKNSLITMYGKCGDFYSSNFIFHGLPNKNSITWNAVVAANAHHGHGEEALKLFREMINVRVPLDQFSFSASFAAAANLAIVEEGKQIHSLVIKLGFNSNLYVINALMDMYGKCGEMNDVLKLVPEPIYRTRLSWNVLISALSRHGCFHEARETFYEMLKVGPKPDHVTFVSLLSACSHGGLVNEGLWYFKSMTKDYGVPPGIEHCVCIIDLYGRSGLLSEAESFIEEMPVPPNELVWRSLLAACKTHGNLELGKKAAKKLVELDPSDDSAYVLYSNVCATTGKWEEVESIRQKMVINNIKKKPACSWVKLKNKVSLFGMGDDSHPQAKQIYSKLDEIRKMIKEAGYVADTSFALHDTDEEQKEQNLWNHSERLALAFGLINTPEGSTLRIFKNLRVCGDCHSFYKFVSGIIRREIVLRDPYRFHHFRNGECSCCDYW